ncbi:MAG: non-canonical purine NTP pyrophosphatase [Candidatus Doudnabacteria bacterium]
MKNILISMENKTKLNEYVNLLKGLDLKVVSAQDLKIPDPEERATSFEEEAVRKANYYAEKSGLPSLVEVGGFEIEALGGAPGIRSKNWDESKMTDEQNIAEVFKRLEGKYDRSAKHSIVIAFSSSLGVFTSHSEVVGMIPAKPSDKRLDKFPYRSVLFLPNYNKYWVELTHEEEEILNHRKYALEKLVDILKDLNK